jgi:hypothetical protein
LPHVSDGKESYFLRICVIETIHPPYLHVEKKKIKIKSENQQKHRKNFEKK